MRLLTCYQVTRARTDTGVLSVPREGTVGLSDITQYDYGIQEAFLQPVAKGSNNAWSGFEQTTETRVENAVESWVRKV